MGWHCLSVFREQIAAGPMPGLLARNTMLPDQAPKATSVTDRRPHRPQAPCLTDLWNDVIRTGHSPHLQRLLGNCSTSGGFQYSLSAPHLHLPSKDFKHPATLLLSKRTKRITQLEPSRWGETNGFLGLIWSLLLCFILRQGLAM